MAKEKLETTNKLIIPNAWKDAKANEILKSLEAISNEEIMKAWEELEKAQKELENPQELKDFREAWKEKIRNIAYYDVEKIIKAAENIPVKVEKDSDGSRLIEFKLWNKKYKILDSNLESHTDDYYRYKPYYDSITHIHDYVRVGWMWWDDVDRWENEELKKYVKEKQRKRLHIPKIEEMKSILQELWKKAGLSAENHQIAMLMYLTWMDWEYWLSMWDYESSGSQGSRSHFYCCDGDRRFTYDFDEYNTGANLCMIDCGDGESSKNTRTTSTSKSSSKKDMIDFFGSINKDPDSHY